jgi:hypothetical protein
VSNTIYSGADNLEFATEKAGLATGGETTVLFREILKNHNFSCGWKLQN